MIRLRVRFIFWAAGLLVCPAAHNAAAKKLHIESGLGKPPTQLIEQFGMRRRIARVHIIDRIDDSPAKEMPPDPVDHRPSEKRVLPRSHPFGERGAKSLLVVCLELRAA